MPGSPRCRAAASVTKSRRGGKAALAWCLAAGAVMAEPAIDQEIRACVANATSTAALAACEQQGLAAWRARVEELHQQLLTGLPAAQRPGFEEAHGAWEAYRKREFAWIDLSFAQRRDGLSAPLASGAKSELLRQRAVQLGAYLGNLPGAKSD